MYFALLVHRHEFRNEHPPSLFQHVSPSAIIIIISDVVDFATEDESGQRHESIGHG
jgi:hypothetical protein